ncbi:hypothetical protein HDU76_001301 [Blyttiomyces sp. JEL0837]|nr:hypothetical protein HDU76_001301 [Blyttiomyces sp. JEL0837]
MNNIPAPIFLGQPVAAPPPPLIPAAIPAGVPPTDAQVVAALAYVQDVRSRRSSGGATAADESQAALYCYSVLTSKFHSLNPVAVPANAPAWAQAIVAAQNNQTAALAALTNTVTALTNTVTAQTAANTVQFGVIANDIAAIRQQLVEVRQGTARLYNERCGVGVSRPYQLLVGSAGQLPPNHLVPLTNINVLNGMPGPMLTAYENFYNLPHQHHVLPPGLVRNGEL